MSSSGLLEGGSYLFVGGRGMKPTAGVGEEVWEGVIYGFVI